MTLDPPSGQRNWASVIGVVGTHLLGLGSAGEGYIEKGIAYLLIAFLLGLALWGLNRLKRS